MHPSIKIISLIVFASCLSAGHWLEIAVSATILLLCYLFQPFRFFKKALRMSMRLKWLFLSIFLVYGLFLPVGVQGAWLEGLLRINILILIVFAVNLILCVSSRDSLVMGIYYLTKPLDMFGMVSQRLAARMVLTMEYVEQLMREPIKISDKGTPLQRLAETGAAWIRNIEDKATQKQSESIQIDMVSPPIHQWLWPLMIITSFILI